MCLSCILVYINTLVDVFRSSITMQLRLWLVENPTPWDCSTLQVRCIQKIKNNIAGRDADSHKKGRCTGGVEHRIRCCCRNKRTMRHCIPAHFGKTVWALRILCMCVNWQTAGCFLSALNFLSRLRVVVVTPVRLVLKCVVVSCWGVDEILGVRSSVLIKWLKLCGLGVERFNQKYQFFLKAFLQYRTRLILLTAENTAVLRLFKKKKS